MSHQFERSIFEMMSGRLGGLFPFMQLNVRRERLIHDTITQLHSMADSDLKKPLKVSSPYPYPSPNPCPSPSPSPSHVLTITLTHILSNPPHSLV